jgi:integrase
MIKKNLPKNVVEKDNIWYVRRCYTDKTGKRRQIWRKCDSQNENSVREILLRIDKEIQKIKSGKSVRKTPQPFTPKNKFKEIAQKFEKDELINPIYVNQKKVAGKKSVSRNKYQLKVLTDYFGNHDIAQITFNDCLQFKIKRLQTPVKTKYGERPRAIRTVHYELSTLRQVFNFAIRERIISRSPFQDGKGLICPSDDARRFVELSDEEQRRLVENCPAHVPYLKVIVIGCLDAGFRLGEILQLRWEQIDFQKNEIRLWNWQTKSAKMRVLPLTKRFKETLLAWREENPVAEKVINVTYMRKVWYKLRASINREDLTIHDLRHCFATQLHRRGVNIVTIQKLLGHANIQTTMIYINPTNDELHEAIRFLD